MPALETTNLDSAGEIGGVFAGLVALLVALGQGARWALNWKDAREKGNWARLKAHEASLDRREKEYHEKTDKRLAAMEHKAALMFALNLQLVGELERLDAGSPVLVRVRLAMKEAFAIDPDLPDWFKTMMQQFDEMGRIK